MDPEVSIQTIERLRKSLLELECSTDSPTLDLAWLRLRCDDTLSLTGQLQRDSILQLQTDIADFLEEFPKLLPVDLLEELPWKI